jgi:hypothetical protein
VEFAGKKGITAKHARKIPTAAHVRIGAGNASNAAAGNTQQQNAQLARARIVQKQSPCILFALRSKTTERAVATRATISSTSPSCSDAKFAKDAFIAAVHM